MPDSLTFALTASSDAAADKALALAESFLKPEVAAELQARLKAVHLRRASIELDVDAPGAGALRVTAAVTVEEPG
jgi:hypothetical protein